MAAPTVPTKEGPSRRPRLPFPTTVHTHTRALTGNLFPARRESPFLSKFPCSITPSGQRGWWWWGGRRRWPPQVQPARKGSLLPALRRPPVRDKWCRITGVDKPPFKVAESLAVRNADWTLVSSPESDAARLFRRPLLSGPGARPLPGLPLPPLPRDRGETRPRGLLRGAVLRPARRGGPGRERREPERGQWRDPGFVRRVGPVWATYLRPWVPTADPGT